MWVGLVAALGLALVACGQVSPMLAPVTTGMATGGTRTVEGGGVTISATWAGPGAGPVFAVALETHRVDLDGYDLGRLAVLRADEGAEIAASGWDAPTGGHHREGTLTFPTVDHDGRPTVDQGTRTLRLIIRDVAGVPERSFAWSA